VPTATPPGNRELFHMSGFNYSRQGSSEEMHAFDPPLTHEILPPAPDDDEEEGVQQSETAEVEEEKQKNEVATKEAMLRATGGQV
jgi:hypothetical protein